MAALRAASLALTDRFIAGVEATCPTLTLATPRDPASRGSQVSFRHPEGYAIMQALIARGVIGDFRAPDILRFGFTPLFIGAEEVDRAVAILAEVMASPVRTLAKGLSARQSRKQVEMVRERVAGMLPERDPNPDLAVARRVLTGLILGAAAAPDPVVVDWAVSVLNTSMGKQVVIASSMGGGGYVPATVAPPAGARLAVGDRALPVGWGPVQGAWVPAGR